MGECTTAPARFLGPDRWHDDTIVVGVVEDAALRRRRLVTALERLGDVEVVAEGPEPSLLHHRPTVTDADVVVLPLAVQPDGGAAEVIRLLNVRPAAAALVFDDGEDDRPLLHVQLAGARGVLPRDSDVDVVAAAVRAVAAGRPVLPGRAAGVLAAYLRGPATVGGLQTPAATLEVLDRWSADAGAALSDVGADVAGAMAGPSPWRRVAVALARAQRVARTVGLLATRAG